MAKDKINLFDVVPSVCEHITTGKENNISVISFPRFPNKFMQRCLASFAKSKFICIRLDEDGSAVWELIDGKRTVRDISSELAGYFENAENYETRVTLFISQLRANGFIKYKMPL